MTDYSTDAQAVAEAMNSVYENKQTNKKNDISGDYSSDNASYPTVKAVKTAYGTKKTSWASTPSDSDIPSEKLVKDSLDNKISKSSTSGLMKNDGTVDTNTYLTSASISGKENTSNKVTSWSSTTTDAHYPSEKLVKTSLDDKISKSSTTGLVKNDGTIDTNSYITSSAISGKFDTAGTGLTNSGTTVSADIGGSTSTSSSKLVACNDTRLSDARTPTSHSHGDITNTGYLGSTANKPLITTTGGKISVSSFGNSANTFCQGNDSRLSDARTPTAHNQATSTITNNTAFDNILAGESTTLTLTDQAKINSAIDTKIGTLSSLSAIVIVDSKPTASASTMGKLYIVSENSKVNVYYTVENSGSYSWHKMDTDILDEYTVSWNDVQNKPSSFTPASHTHGNITNEGKVGSASGKPLITTTGGVVTTGAFGTSSGQFAEGNHTHNYTTTSDVQSEISSFASALASAINPSS